MKLLRTMTQNRALDVAQFQGHVVIDRASALRGIQQFAKRLEDVLPSCDVSNCGVGI